MTESIFTRQNLRAFNTMGLPATALVAELSTVSAPQIQRLLEAGARLGRPLFVLGAGSNLIVHPQPRHCVLRPTEQGIDLWAQTAEHTIVQVAAGTPWHDCVAYCMAQGWYGLENLALIPGTAGAAPVQNIGAYGLEIAARLHSVLAWDLQRQSRHELPAAACNFSYRDSMFKQAGAGRWLISHIRLALPRRWQAQIDYPDLRAHFGGAKPSPEEIFAAVCQIRAAKLPDPAQLANAGSFFKNPLVAQEQAAALRAQYPAMPQYPQADSRVKIAAAWLIDQCGWRGKTLGAVGVHQRQALVLVNHGGASFADIRALAASIVASVAHKFGVRLEQEPVLLD